MRSRPLSSTPDTHIQLLIGHFHLDVRQTSQNHHFKLNSWFPTTLLLMAVFISVDGNSILWGSYLCPKPWNHLHSSLLYSTFNASRYSIDSTFQIYPQSSHFPLPPHDHPVLSPHHLSPCPLRLLPYPCSCFYLCSLVVSCQQSKQTDSLKCKIVAFVCFGGFSFHIESQSPYFNFQDPTYGVTPARQSTSSYTLSVGIDLDTL